MGLKTMSDVRDRRRAAGILAGTVELTWRCGAFVCLLVVVMRSPIWDDLHPSLALLAALGVVCFLPRPEFASLTLGIIVLVIVIGRSTPGLPLNRPDGLSAQMALSLLAIALVACAGVLRVVMSKPERGIFDRDIGVLLLGWLAAGQVWLFATASVSPRAPSIDPEPSGTPLFVGEPALFLNAAWISVMVVMLVLSIVAVWRTASIRDPRALASHPLTGAGIAAVTWMAAGNTLGVDLMYPWFGAVAGALAGVIVWAVVYTVSPNEHVRTWGALYALILGFGLALIAYNIVAVPDGDPWGSLARAAWAILLLGMASWFAWRRLLGGPRRYLQRSYREAVQVERLLDTRMRVSRIRTDRPFPLSPEALAAAREELRRVRAVHAAATGDEFVEVYSGGTPNWRANNVPDLLWLRAAARAGRWHVFTDKWLLRGSALSEVKSAVTALNDVRTKLADEMSATTGKSGRVVDEIGIPPQLVS